MSRRRPRPNLPTLVYDDDCGFCTWCAGFAARHSEIDLVGFGDLTDEEAERLPDDWEDCAHLLVDDEVYSCGRSIELSIAWAFPATRPLFGLARKLPGYERLREGAYRLAADNRDILGQIVNRDRIRDRR